MKQSEYRILAEYCHGPFYMGWHLYVRERTDGIPNADGGWGWCQSALSVERVRDLCLTMGYRDEDIPEVNYHSGSGKYHEFVDWFAYEFPLGVGVERADFGAWKQVPFHLDADLERDLVDPRPRLYFFYRNGGPIATVAANRGAAREALLL